MHFSILGLVAATAVTAYLGLHHLVLAGVRRDQRVHQWIAAYCGVTLLEAAARLLHYTTTTPSVAVLAMRLELLLVYPLAFAVVSLAHELAGSPMPRGLRWAMLGFSLPAMALTGFGSWVVTDAVTFRRDVLGQTVPWVELAPLHFLLVPYGVSLFLWSARLLLRSTTLDRRSRIVLLVALTVYIVAALNDAVLGVTRGRSVLIFEYGFFALAVAFDSIAMIRLYEGLSGEVDQRTAELSAANRELSASIEEARAATAAKTAVLANVSHELRTPLNAVIGMTTLLSETVLDADQREMVETARKSGEVLLHLLADALDFSKIEAGRLQLEEVEFSLERCLLDAVEGVAPDAYEKDVEIVLDIAPDGVEEIGADFVRLRQIVTNLVGNAVKFTSDGGVVSIHGCTRPLDGREIEVEIAVRDTGIGLSAEQIGRLFQPFTQADASTTRRFGGTGLGLSICKALVEKMGGSIKVESEVSVGSTFTFTIRARAVSTESSRRSLHGTRVVVAVEREPLRTMVRTAFAAAGAQLISPRGADLPLLVSEERPQLVVLDSCPKCPDHDARDLEIPGFAPSLLRLRPPRSRDSVNVELGAPRNPRQANVYKPLGPHELLEAAATLLEVRVQSERKKTPALGTSPRPDRVLSVLITDDNPINREVARRMVEHLGHRTVLAGSGAEALMLLESRSFDVVLMDVQMPDLDGFETTRRILARPGKKPRVVGLSASTLHGDREKALVAGMDDYLTKPVQLGELAATLSKGAKRSSPATGPIPSTIDPKVIEALRAASGDGDDAVIALVDFFFDDLEQKLPLLQTALVRDDLETSLRIAHTLKGSAGSIGAARLSQFFRTLESTLRGGEVTVAESILKVAREEQARAREAFSVLFDRGRRSVRP